MKLKDARKKIEENRKLIGTFYNEDKISKLIIVPINPDRWSDIINRAIDNMQYKGLLVGFTDFTVLALLNVDTYPIEGNMFYRQLDEILFGLNQLEGQ